MKYFILVVLLILINISSSLAVPVHVKDGGGGLSVLILESSEDRIVLDVSLSEFDQIPIDIDGGTWNTVYIPGESNLREEGLPDLPHVCRSVIISNDACVKVSIIDSEYQDIPDFYVAPSRGHLERQTDPNSFPFIFDPFYEENDWYPETRVVAHEPYILRDHRGLCIEVHPFQYNPAMKTLRVYTRMVVEITGDGPGKKNVLRNNKRGQVNGDFQQIYRNHFVNYDLLNERVSSEVGEMLIITHDDFRSDIEPLADWKNQAGMKTTVVNISTIGNDSTSIGDYIQSFYDSTDLAYVLLVGDGPQIAHHMVTTGAADPVYALVAGDDYYPDLFVGRFSGSNSYQIRTQVDRTIRYERDATDGDEWYHKGMGVASDRGPGHNDEYDYEHIALIRDDLLLYNYTEVDHIVDPGATAVEVTDGLNAGRGIVNYCGHGDTNEWSTTHFSYAQVEALTNDNMLPFIFDVTCENGNFSDGGCIAESWMWVSNGTNQTGAAAIYASSIIQYWDPPMCAQDEFNEYLIDENFGTFGGLCFAASCHMIDEFGNHGAKMFRGWHVFGDPSLRIRTDTPEIMSVIHSNSVIGSATYFDVIVPGVPGAVCCISLEGVIYGSGTVDASGDAEIVFQNPLPNDEDMQLTVTAFNKVTYVDSVHVVPDPTCDVYPQAVDVYLVPGESQRIYFGVSNNGNYGSVLTYTVDITGDVPGKDISGSTWVADLNEYASGETFDIVFTITNTSTDYEYLKYATLEFPEEMTVNSSTDFVVIDETRSLNTNGATGAGATVYWSAPGYWGEVQGGKSAQATVNVTVDGNMMGDLQLVWELEGDGWGASPHFSSGTILLSPDGPQVLVGSPNGGEEWGIEEERSITWSSNGDVDSVRIDYSIDAGGAWIPVSSSTGNSGLYTWMVPSPESDQCLVRVSTLDETGSDTSNDLFTVFQPITWAVADPESGSVLSGTVEYVQLDFDASGMPGGVHEAYIVFASNAGDPVVVPVTMHISSAAIDPDRSTITANNNLVMAPDGSGDSTLVIRVTVRGGNGLGIPGIPAGAVVVTGDAWSNNGQEMCFCSFGSAHPQFLSTSPTDFDGRTTILMSTAGGCGTVALTAEVQGVFINSEAVVNIRTPDLNGSGSMNFTDSFFYIPLLGSGYGWCGNFSGDTGDIVNFLDTAEYLRCLAQEASCP